jgi:hypothetical protein
MPRIPRQNAPTRPSLPLNDAKSFQSVVAKETQMKQAKDDQDSAQANLDERDLLQLLLRNHDKEDQACANVPLEDVLLGPGHVAWKLIKAIRESDSNLKFNEEQVLAIALQIWPLEQAWRIHAKDKQSSTATLHSLRKLPNDLGLPRVCVLGGGGCGKTTITQEVVAPTLRTFFSKVALTMPSNRAARGFEPRAKTTHSVAGMRPQDSFRTSTLHIKNDQMRKNMDANQTHAGAWVRDEALQTAAPGP